MSDKASGIQTKRVIGNILYAFSVQAVSLLLSLFMSLFVPKYMGTTEFGYWQLFIFYTSYVGFFHFGLNDGLYLRNGGTDYKDMDYTMIGSQFWASIVGQSVIAAGILLYGFFGVDDPEKCFVYIMTAIYLVIVNAGSFLGYVLQAGNKINAYSTSVLIDKVFFIIVVLVLIFRKEADYRVYVTLYLGSKILCLLYCMIVARKAVFVRPCGFRALLTEMGINISVGINLMLSNIAGMLVLGVGRFVVEHIWGVEAFGIFSFAISMTNFFLTFISQVSIVLFPALKRIREDQLKDIYITGRAVMNLLLAAVFICYLPMKWALSLWLPQYNESVLYLALLLPLCTFDGKMNMLCATYMKVMRKERVLLFVNVICVAVSGVLSLVGGYVLKNINSIIVFMVVATAVRSTISDIYVSRKLGIGYWSGLIGEFAMAAIFVLPTWFIGATEGFFIYLVAYAVYLIFCRKTVKLLFQKGIAILKKEKK